MPGMQKKHNLATKICPTCGRAFSWRKKWRAVWDDVKYCSQRCRRARSAKPDQKQSDHAQ